MNQERNKDLMLLSLACILADKHRREKKRCSWMRGMAGSPRPKHFFASGYTDQKVWTGGGKLILENIFISNLRTNA